MHRPFSFSKFSARLNDSRPLGKLPRTRRKKPRTSRFESLEFRNMLTPLAVDDSYQASGNTTLNVNSTSGVLANDVNRDMLPLTASVVANPGHGSLTLNGNGSFSYTPTTNYTGVDTFTYHVTDFAGTSNTATVTITISNPNAPIAVNDSFTVLHDRANSISSGSGVLANDTDPNSLTLSASVVANPSHGSVSLNSNGSFTYTPTAGYTGSDSFTYQDSNGTYTSNVATVSLTVNDPHAPVPGSDYYSPLHDHTYSTTAVTGVVSNDYDADGDSLTASLVSGPSHGSLTLNSDGSFDYTPSTHYTGSDSFSYKPFDGVLYSGSPMTVFISVSNNPPVPANDNYNLANAQTFNVSASSGVLHNDYDADSDTLAASVVSGPSHGSLTLNTDGSFSYTPNSGWLGQDSFTYAASDGVASANATVTLNTQYSILSLDDLTKPALGTVQAGLQILGSPQGTAGTAQNLSVSYDSVAGQGDAVIEASAGLSNPANVTETVTASLTFNGVAQPNVYFTMATLGQANATVHLAEQVDTSSLATGRYPFSLTITSPDMAAPATINGFVNVVNDSASPVGKGWNMPGVLRLFSNSVSGVPAGVLLSTGDGQGWYFTQGAGSTYTSPAGPYAFSTLTSVTGGWQLVDQHGTSFNFNSSGYLASRVERTTETTTYGYTSGLLTSITDAFSRSVALAYTSGLLTSITDFAGNVTSFGHTGSNLTTITEPNPGGGAPVWTYGYTGNYLTSVTDPTSAQTSYSYDTYHRLSGVTLPGGARDSASAEQSVGYGSTSSGSPANLLLQSSVTPTTTDALGHSSGYQTDLLGNVTSMTDANGKVTTYQLDANGLVTTLTQPSPDGVQPAPVTTYTYDSLGNQTSASGALDSFGTYVYNSFSESTSFTDSLSHVTSWTYDTHGNMLTKTDPLGNVTTWTYDSLGRPLTMTLPDPDGAGPLAAPEYQYTYDSYERLVTITNPDSTTQHFTYDADDRPLTVEDENSHTTTTVYDALGRVTSVTNAASGVVSYTYDLVGRVLTTTDEMGNATTNIYNSRGELTSTTLPDPDGAGPLTSPVWSYTYDSGGNKLTQTDPLGRITAWSYDNLNRISTVTLPDPDGAGPLSSPVTTYGYDYLGRKTSVTNPAGGLTAYAYNSHNWLTSITAPDPDGAGPLTSSVTSYGYDSIGRHTAVTDPMSHVTTTAYDADGRRTSLLDNLGHATTYTYDNLGNMLTTTDALSHTTTNVYDSRSRLLSATDSLSGTTQYTYDSAGNRLTLEDPDSNTTTWTYDSLNRVLTDTDQLTHVRSYSYNASGDLTSETDRDGRVRDFTYDNLHRQTAEEWLSGSSVIRNISYSYDAANQVTSASDPDSSYAYAYDDLGRVTSVDNNGTPGVSRVVLSSQYDAMTNRTQFAGTISGTADFLNTYTYDADQQLTTMQQEQQPGGAAISPKEVDFAYNALAQLASIAYYNYIGTGPRTDIATSTYSYDGGSRLTALAYTSNGGVSAIDTFGWGYDAANNVTSFTSNAGTATYSLDNTNQVTGATYTGANQPGNESYSYDGNGNRTNYGYSTSANNQLGSDGTFNYQYDAEGNRTVRTRLSSAYATDYETTYAWDYRNRLTDVEFFDNNGVLTKHVLYVYDLFDHLIATELDSTGSGSYNHVEHYVLDFSPETPQAGVPGTALAQPVFQFDGSGNLTIRYFEAIDRIFAEGAVSSSTSPDTVSWMLNDYLGSVRDVLDNSSNVIDQINYSSYGQVSYESNPSVHHFAGFTGGHVDQSSGLVNDYHRWYDPAVGRWISQDPMGFVAADANLDRYVHNYATELIDSTGLLPQKPAPKPGYYVIWIPGHIGWVPETKTVERPVINVTITGWKQLGPLGVFKAPIITITKTYKLQTIQEAKPKWIAGHWQEFQMTPFMPSTKPAGTGEEIGPKGNPQWPIYINPGYNPTYGLGLDQDTGMNQDTGMK